MALDYDVTITFNIVKDDETSTGTGDGCALYIPGSPSATAGNSLEYHASLQRTGANQWNVFDVTVIEFPSQPFATWWLHQWNPSTTYIIGPGVHTLRCVTTNGTAGVQLDGLWMDITGLGQIGSVHPAHGAPGSTPVMVSLVTTFDVTLDEFDEPLGVFTDKNCPSFPCTAPGSGGGYHVDYLSLSGSNGSFWTERHLADEI